MTPAAMRVFLQHGKALCKPDMRLIQLDDRNYVLASSPQCLSASRVKSSISRMSLSGSELTCWIKTYRAI